MKKLICILTIAAMVFAFSACGDKGPSVPGTQGGGSPTDIEIPEATPTPEPQPVTELFICGIPVVMDSQLTGIGYQGAIYDNGVLTLENVELIPDNGNRALSFSGDLEIVLKGVNKISTNGTMDVEAGIYAADITDAEGKVTASSNLKLSGDGSLVINAAGGAESDGIWSTGTVTVTATGSIDITGATHAIHDEAELIAEGAAIVEQTDTRVVFNSAAV